MPTLQYYVFGRFSFFCIKNCFSAIKIITLSSYSEGNNSVKFKKMLRHKENIVSQAVSLVTLSGAVCISASSRNAGVILPPPYVA